MYMSTLKEGTLFQGTFSVATELLCGIFAFHVWSSALSQAEFTL